MNVAQMKVDVGDPGEGLEAAEDQVPPKPGALKVQRQPSPKRRARPYTPVADALAAWRAYFARRHAKGNTTA
jgi:hypothetical protein